MGKKWRPMWRRKKKSQKEAQGQNAAPKNEPMTSKTGGERPSHVDDGSTATCGCISRVRSRFGCGTAPASPCNIADIPVWHVVRLNSPQTFGDGSERSLQGASEPCKDAPSLLPRTPDADAAASAPAETLSKGEDKVESPSSISPSARNAALASGPKSTDESSPRALDLQLVASGDDSSNLLHTAPSSFVTISATTDDGDCPPGGSPALLLGDSPARALNPVVDSTTATTPVPVLDDRAAAAGWLLGRLSPIPESEHSDLNNTPALSNVGGDIELLISPSGVLRLDNAVNTPTPLIFNKTAELPSRLLLDNNASSSSVESPRNTMATACDSVSLANWLEASTPDGDSTAQPASPSGALALAPVPSTPLTAAHNAMIAPDSVFAWSLPPPSSAASLANSSQMASPLPSRRRAGGASSPLSSVGDNFPALEDDGDEAAALLMLGQGEAQPDSGALLTWRTNELAVCDPEDSGDAAAALLMLDNDAQTDNGALRTWGTNELAVRAPPAADDGDEGCGSGDIQSLLRGPAEAQAVDGIHTLVLYNGASTNASTFAVSNPLLGQLDITTAEAQMAQRELAIVKADALALQEDVRALEEEVLYERETSMAARRRADAFERQMADHERKVRSLEDCLGQTRMELVAVELDAERAGGQVIVLESEIAASKAAAQAAAESAARDIAALTTDLIRSDARCQELQSAHVEEMAVATSELRRARDETSTLADDMIAMAEKSSRDEEHIAALQAALREAQESQRSAAALVAACTAQIAAWVSPPGPADTPAGEGGGSADAWSADADRNDGADDALDAAERGCARSVLAPLVSDAAAKPAACRDPTAACPVSSCSSPVHESVAAARPSEAASPRREPLQELPLPARGTGNILRRTVSGGAAAAAATASLLRTTSAKWKKKLVRIGEQPMPHADL